MQQRVSIFLCLIILVMAGCKRQDVKKAMPPLEVQAARVVADSVVMRYEFVTHLQSGYEVVIQPRVSGYIIKSNVRAGMPVKRGDLLFVLDAELLTTSLREAQAKLVAAQAQEVEARNNYERAAPLAQISAISRAQMDDYEATYSSARQQVRIAREQVANAELQIGYTRIYSPIDGIVAYTTAHPGDYVGAGTQYSTLTTISNMDRLRAEISIPTSLYLQHVKRDQAAYDNRGLLSDIKLYLDDGSQYEFEGEYDYTRQNISPTSGTITLVVDFPNPAYRLKVGEYARLQTAMGEKQYCVLVRSQAVESIQGVNSVWVIGGDSTVNYRRVELGRQLGEWWVVSQGLMAGEVVALTGGMKLRDGEKVIAKIVEREKE